MQQSDLFGGFPCRRLSALGSGNALGKACGNAPLNGAALEEELSRRF